MIEPSSYLHAAGRCWEEGEITRLMGLDAKLSKLHLELDDCPLTH